jgi:hypothetical protein
MFVSTILAGTTYSKLALNLWVKINTFFTVRASREIFAVFCRVNEGAEFRSGLAIWPMPAFYLFLLDLTATLFAQFFFKVNDFFLLRLFDHLLPTRHLKSIHSIHPLRISNLI